jgi:S-adenosylmethionine-diacylgycerolhomoserine-N-methlytransferase
MSDAALTMDRIYSWQTGLYDATRRYYLLGRDQLIEALAPPPGSNVLEIGCGTGRNLVKASARWPDARLHGLDISRVMLAKAQKSLQGRARLAQADATDCAPDQIFGCVFHRVYFSYTLSMIPDWTAALDKAAAALPPGGAVLIADFGDQSGLPLWFRRVLRKWLALFHVTPCPEAESVLRAIAAQRGLACDFVPLYRGYAFVAALRRTTRV